jgi:hypothetical protein
MKGKERHEEPLQVLLTRSLVTFISGVAALYFTYWAGGALVYALGMSPWVPYIGSLAAGGLTARYVWRHTSSTEPGFVSAVVLGALVTGGIGFSAGFFGPIIFMPGANQGPLLGILITGPLGFLAGAVGGAIWWRMQRRRLRSDRADLSGGRAPAPPARLP